MAAYSFTDVAIASYQAGYNVFQSIGLAAVTASVAYAGATFGAELFKWGGAEAIAAFGAGAFGGMSGGVAHAAMTGGNIGLGALSGLAAGATGGLFATSGNLFLSAAGSSVAGGVGSSVAGGGFAAGAVEGAYAGAANTAMATAVASGNLQAGRDAIAEAGEDAGIHPLVAQKQHDQALVKTVNSPGEISKLQQFKQSKWGAFLETGLETAGKFSSAVAFACGYTAATGGPFTAPIFGTAALLFAGIAAISSALQIAIYSDTPGRDTTVEVIKMGVSSQIEDEAIGYVVDEIMDVVDETTR